jgi:Camelysin metallo-endopeptidase
MKKIALASAAMGGAALIAFGASGTFAAFSDSETTSAAAGAATLDLRAGVTNAPSGEVALNMAPGDKTLYFPLYVHNAGDLDGFLGGTFTFQDLENGCSGDEVDVDETCGAAGDDGEFAENVMVGATVTLNGTAANCTAKPGSDELAAPTRLPALGSGSFEIPSVLPLPKNLSACVVVSVELPKEAGNEVQGDSSSLTASLKLDQFQARPTV